MISAELTTESNHSAFKPLAESWLADLYELAAQLHVELV